MFKKVSGVLSAILALVFLGIGVLQLLWGVLALSLILVKTSSQDLAIGISVSSLRAFPLMHRPSSASTSELKLVLQTRWRTSSAHVTICEKMSVIAKV